MKIRFKNFFEKLYNLIQLTYVINQTTFWIKNKLSSVFYQQLGVWLDNCGRNPIFKKEYLKAKTE